MVYPQCYVNDWCHLDWNQGNSVRFLAAIDADIQRKACTEVPQDVTRDHQRGRTVVRWWKACRGAVLNLGS